MAKSNKVPSTEARSEERRASTQMDKHFNSSTAMNDVLNMSPNYASRASGGGQHFTTERTNFDENTHRSGIIL